MKRRDIILSKIETLRSQSNQVGWSYFEGFFEFLDALTNGLKLRPSQKNRYLYEYIAPAVRSGDERRILEDAFLYTMVHINENIDFDDGILYTYDFLNGLKKYEEWDGYKSCLLYVYMDSFSRLETDEKSPHIIDAIKHYETSFRIDMLDRFYIYGILSVLLFCFKDIPFLDKKDGSLILSQETCLDFERWFINVRFGELLVSPHIS